MSDAQLDSFPISESQHRYQIVCSNVYNHLEALNIKPEKKGGRADVNGEQLQLLDALAGISGGRLRAAIKDGTLSAQIIGRGYCVKRTNLEDYVDNL